MAGLTAAFRGRIFRSLAATYGTDFASYRRAQLVNTILLLMVVVNLVIGAINLLHFGSVPIGLANLVGAGVGAALWVYFRWSMNLSLTSWLMVIVLLALLVNYLYIARGVAYSIVWVSVFAPISVFLLGRKGGLLISAGLFTYVLLLFGMTYGAHESRYFTTGSVLNLAEVFVCLVLLFYFYEFSRDELFRELRERNAELDRLSTRDPVTGMKNRRGLDATLQALFPRTQRYREPLSVVLLDIDHFKQINDRFGHLVGDETINAVGRIISKSRPEHAVAGRWGGEEFLMICPGTSAAQARDYAELLRQAIERESPARCKPVTASLGVAVWQPGDTPERLMNRADQALYGAKNAGRNTVVMAADA